VGICRDEEGVGCLAVGSSAGANVSAPLGCIFARGSAPGCLKLPLRVVTWTGEAAIFPGGEVGCSIGRATAWAVGNSPRMKSDLTRSPKPGRSEVWVSIGEEHAVTKSRADSETQRNMATLQNASTNARPIPCPLDRKKTGEACLAMRNRNEDGRKRGGESLPKPVPPVNRKTKFWS
jgi:hypothetical protein